jgi:hypothetical protein
MLFVRLGGGVQQVGRREPDSALAQHELHVVRRIELLDGERLEQRRFERGRRRRERDVADLRQHFERTLGGARLLREMRRHSLLQAGRLADVEHVAVGAQKTVYPGLIRQRAIARGRQWIAPFARRLARFGGRQPVLQRGPSRDALQSELRHELVPNEGRCLYVAERASLQVQAVAQKSCQGSQAPARQIRIEPTSDGVHTHRVERKGRAWLEALRPVLQE